MASRSGKIVSLSMPKIRIGMYHVSVLNNPRRSVRDIVTAAAARVNDHFRAKTTSKDEPMPLRRLDIQQDYCVGEFRRIRPAHVQGERSALTAQRGEQSPRDRTLFLIDFVANVLHIEEHQGTATDTALARHLKAVGEVLAVITIPVRKIERLKKSGHDRGHFSGDLANYRVGNKLLCEQGRIADGDRRQFIREAWSKHCNELRKRFPAVNKKAKMNR